MTTTTDSVQVTIAPDALEYADRHGLREALASMIDQMKAMAPRLELVRVTLEFHPEFPDEEPQILINGIEALDARPLGDTSLLDAYRAWKLASFPPEVLIHFVTVVFPGSTHGW